MSKEKTIAVIGVTGIQVSLLLSSAAYKGPRWYSRLFYQGASVARTFLKLPGWKVRGITRDTKKEAAEEMTAQGVELVRADLDDQASLLEAFRGASAIFANTDFFLHLFAALDMGEDQLRGQTPNQYAYRREVEQNLNAAAAASEPSVLKTLDRFVLSSLGDARTLSGGKYETVYHFDSKAEVPTESDAAGILFVNAGGALAAVAGAIAALL